VLEKPDPMKRSLLIIPALIALAVILTVGCDKKKTNEPCDNMGRICITNKLDSISTIQIVQLNQVFEMDKDYMQCLSLLGNNPYTFKVTCNTFYLDTTILIQACDDIQLILEK